MDSSVTWICSVSSFSILWNNLSSWGAKSPPSLNNLQEGKTHFWSLSYDLFYQVTLVPRVPPVTWRSWAAVMFCLWPPPVWSEQSVWRWSHSTGCLWYVHPDSPGGWSWQSPDCRYRARQSNLTQVLRHSVIWPQIIFYRWLLSADWTSSSMLDRVTLNFWFFLLMEVCSSCNSNLQEVNTSSTSSQWSSTHCLWHCSSTKNRNTNSLMVETLSWDWWR